MKRINKSTLMIAGLAFLAFVLTYALLAGVVSPRQVVVARVDLAAGTRLTADLLELRTLPGNAIPEGAYTTLEQASGQVITTARVAGDPITAYVAGENAASGLPSQLSLDMVAIAVRVDQATGLAGILRPGQRVAVIAVVDPASLPQGSLQSYPAEPDEAIPGGEAAAVQPPLSPAARLVITGLRVLVVPQSFRYEEAAGGEDSFLPARTSLSQQQESVIVLEAPLGTLPVAPGFQASPAELLALLNQVAVIHLALEPSQGLAIRIEALPAVDLASLYQGLTGYRLIP